jgi:hypothetical protein
MMKYRVTLVEYERGWGSRPWTEDFNTREQAEAHIKETNAMNTEKIVPDWYVIALEDIEVVE